MHAQGSVLVKCGRVGEGLGLLDEAMVTATDGELSPIVTGIVYCGVILACEEVYELRRAREWTAVLTRWCEQQPDLVAFTGRCLVHRAQLMQLHGAWPDALEEAERAGERFERAMNQAARAKRCYLQGEVYRLRGEFAEAEEAYREASQLGLRAAAGPGACCGSPRETPTLRPRRSAARSARRPIGRSGPACCPAYVEILLAVGDRRRGAAACAELEEIAAAVRQRDAARRCSRTPAERSSSPRAMPAARSRRLRRAAQAWQELEAPYEAARARVLVGQACRELGDEDAFALELDAARGVFEQLGAGAGPCASRRAHGTGRSRRRTGLTRA